MRLGLLGCGDIARAHLNAAAETDRIEATSVYDTDRELANRVARAHGVSAAGHLEDFYRDLDAVSIALPHDLHLPAVVDALSHGVRSILIEKPLAQSSRDAKAIIDECESQHAHLAVWHVARYDPEVQAARRFVASGAIGTIVSTSINLHRDKPASYWLGADGRPSWRSSQVRSGGGILMMNVIHSLDAMRFVLGEDVATAHAATRCNTRAAEVEDTAVGILEWEGGALGTINASSVSPSWSREPDRIIGTSGEVRYGRTLGALAYSVSEDTGIKPGEWTRLETADGVRDIGEERDAHVARVALLSDFRDWISGDHRTPPPQGRDALQSLATIEALYRSAASGQREEVSV